MSPSTLVVAATENTNSTLRGAAINVFLNFGDGCCRTLVVAATEHSGSTSQGASHQRLAKLGTCRQYVSSDTYQGATAVNTTTTSKTSFKEKVFGFLRC
jgi:hypothetical protein